MNAESNGYMDFKRIWVAAWLAACLSAFGAEGDAALPGQFAQAAAKVQRSETTQGLAKAGRIHASHSRSFRLEPPSADLAELLLGRSFKGMPLKVGFGRDMAGLTSNLETASALEWERRPAGALVAAVDVSSTSAASLRAAIRVENLPATALLRVQAPGSDEIFEVSGEDINAALARNLEAGEKGPDARLYWSPLIEGDAMSIEVQLAPGTDPLDLRISIPQLSHLVTSAAKDFTVVEKSSSSCEIDAMCSVSTWGSQMNAVARMVFSSGGGTYICTGTLLADQDSAGSTPYFLSANHCISTQTSASSLTTYWFYRSSACNSTTIGPYKQLAGGAALLYASTETDTSFMRLNATPPAGAVYAGWFAGATPGVGTLATALHHPQGDWLKISNGRVNGYLTCAAPTSNGFTCDSASSSGSTFYDIGWTTGITEPGSSGSGLFRSDGVLIGQLYGGSGDCTTPGDDVYGRFDVAYNASLKSWLSGQTLSVAKSGTGSGSVTSAPAGINCGTTCSASFTTGTSVTLSAAPVSGSVFAGWSGACTGTGSCVVAMSSAKSVTASFAIGTATLSVSTSGSGVVTSIPAGINCGSTCSASFNLGTTVTLSAVPAVNMAFTGWSGSCSGVGSCIVTMSGARAVTASFATIPSSTPITATLSNMSTRGQVLTGNDVMIAGFVIGGAGSKTVAIVATGPSLAAYGIANPLANPTLTLVRSSDQAIIATNDNWGSAANAAQIQASGFAPPSSLEPAILMNLAPGAYTAVVSGAGGGTGTALVAVYEVDHPEVPLVNVSTRGQVLTGNDVMIGGFVIQGSGAQTVVVTAKGPSLAAYGITNALANPTLTLVRSSDQTVLATNDNWGSAPNAAQIQASGFAPSNPLEPAILIMLPPGAYTAILSGAGGGTGTGIVAVYATQ